MSAGSCPVCGFEWAEGGNVQHSCIKKLRLRLNEAEALIFDQKVDLASAARYAAEREGRIIDLEVDLAAEQAPPELRQVKRKWAFLHKIERKACLKH